MVNVVGMPSNDMLSKVPSLFPSRCFLSHHSWLHRSLSTGDSAGVVNDSDQGTIDGTSDALVNMSMCSRADDYVHLWYSSARVFDCLMPPPETLSGVSGLVSQQ